MSRLLGLLLALLGAALALTSSLIVEQVAVWWFVTCEVLGILVMASGIWMLSEKE